MTGVQTCALPISDSKGKCSGDSGGPSFATINGKRTVVGITSFGDKACQQFGADTRTDIELAFLLANVPELRPTCAIDADCAPGLCFRGGCIGAPFTSGGIGSTCAAGSDCESSQCAIGPDGTRCTELCAVDAANACPEGFTCLGATGGQGACWPSAEDGGCCDASGRGAPTALFAIVLIGLARMIRHYVERDRAVRGGSRRTPGSAARRVLDVRNEREPDVRHDPPETRRSQPAVW